MKTRPFKIHSNLFLVCLIACCWACGPQAPEKVEQAEILPQAELGDYGMGLAVKDVRFLWRLHEDSIDVKLSADTKGWIGIGFNPETPENMKGANFIIGYVKGGEATAFDHYGIEETKHEDDQKIDGKVDFSGLSGSEENGRTEIAFTIPLDSGDPLDRPLSLDRDNTILLAYGRSDSIVLKHRFRAILRVNLATGENSILKMK